MTNPSFLNVVGREVRQDKNGRNYAYLTVKGDDVETFVFPGGRTITAVKPSKVTAVTGYEENYLGVQDFAWSLNKGQVAMGSIVTRNVASYDITGQDGVIRTVNTYSAVVFGDTRDTVAFEAEVNRVFKAAQHPIANTQEVVTTSVVEQVESIKG